MRSRRARDRRVLLGEAGNTSRRKVMVVGAAGMKRLDETRVRAGTPDESRPLSSRDSN